MSLTLLSRHYRISLMRFDLLAKNARYRRGSLWTLLRSGAAFRIARVALAKSGTVTLELALAGVPMVAAYKVSELEYLVGRLLLRRLSSIILTNILLSDNVVPELIQHQCTADNLAAAIIPLFDDTPQRRRQIEAFSRLDKILEIDSPPLRRCGPPKSCWT